MECLLEVTTQVTEAVTLNELAAGFTKRVDRTVRADGVTVHWSHEVNRRYLMLASHGLPQAMVNAEHCLTAGDCLSGVMSVPIRLHERLMGEAGLFTHPQIEILKVERALI